MRKNLFFALAIVISSLSCDDSAPVAGPDPGPDPIPQGFYALQKISGDGQTGAPGEPLADPYVVKVVDEFGGAVPDATVRFQILDNVGGSLTASSVITDAEGDAYVTARLPNDPDATQSVLARMDSATNELTFTSRTTLAASGASVIRIVSGNGQQGPTGDSLPAPLIVEVSNTDGVAVPGVSVKWRVISPNGGAVRETPTLTDGQGLASNSWRLGDVPGATDRVIAWIEPTNAPPDTVTFSAEVTAGPTDIRIVSGNGQTGITLDTLANQLVVEVTDPEGVSVPGVRVNWNVVSADGGSIRESPTFTDELGLAYNSWRLGDQPGAVDSVIAWIEPVSGVPDTVLFSAQVTAGPANIRIVSGNAQTGSAKDTLFFPLVVEVTNIDGVTLANASVQWQVISNGGGSVRVNPTLTDGQGLASNVWRLGDIPGTVDSLIAWIEPVSGVPDTVIFTADVKGGATTIRYISGDDQKGIERDTLLDPLVVEVRDAEGTAVPGVGVKWRVVSADGGAVVQTPTVTNEQGLATNRWRVGSNPGAVDTVIAWIEPEYADPDTVWFEARVTGVPDTIVIVRGAVELDNVYNEPEVIVGDTVFVEPGFWARDPFKGVVLDADGREVRGAILTWTVTDTGGQVGLEPEDGAGEEAVTLNTAEDGAITVWRRAPGCDPINNPTSCPGNWIGATLSIERYPDVEPITLDAFTGYP